MTSRRDHGGCALMTGERYQRGDEDVSDLASPEETAELRGEALVWQMLLHQATAQLSNLAAYPHGTLRRSTLDAVAEHLRSAEKLLGALDDVLDPSRARPGTNCRPGTCGSAWSASGRR